MKTLFQVIILLGLFSTIFSEQSKATILTVDDNNPRIGQFATLKEAHDAANNGDTIMVYPSFGIQAGIAVDKKLVFIGCGFENNTNGIKRTFIAGTMTFNLSSAGSKITGFSKPNSRSYFEIFVDADNISIERNLLTFITINSNHIGTVILNNYLQCYFDSEDLKYLIKVSDNNVILISNNIIVSRGNNISHCIIANGVNTTGNICQNVIINSDWNYLHTGNVAINTEYSLCNVYNNIIGAGYCWGLYYSNNITRLMELQDLSNKKILDFSTVFMDFQNEDYHLKPGSPAERKGLGGTDIGIYGGEFPFIDGGYPSLPVIYSLDVPSTGSQKDGINVTIKAKSNQ